MHTTENYTNREIDAEIMTRRLKWGRNITTQQALARIETLVAQKAEAIRNYKETRHIEHELGELRLLILHRDSWTEYCDDCAHWAGEMG